MKRTLFLLLAFCALASVSLRAAGAVEPVKDPAFQMSPFEVGANSVDFKSWIKIGSPHYVLYTDAKEKEAIQALVEMEKLHVVTQAFFRRRVLNVPRTIVVLPTSRSDWRKLEYKGGVEWKVSVTSVGQVLAKFVLVQYDWQNDGLWTMRAAQAPGVVESLNLKGPFWFSQGIGVYFETLEFDGSKVNLGRANSRVRAVVNDGWIEWGKFFRLTRNSREYTREDTVHQVVGQSAAFAHYMLSNPDPVWLDRFIDWAARWRTGGEPTEADFKAVFGQDWKTWQRTMDDYLRGGKYQMRSMEMPKSALAFPTSAVDLSVSEMRELFVISQILNQNVPASDVALDSILRRGLKNEELRELLAEACLSRRRPEAMDAQVDLLIAAKTANPAVYAWKARKLFYKNMKEISIYPRFTAEEVTELRSLYRRALEIEPLYATALELSAWVEALGPTIDAENIAAIERLYKTVDGYSPTSDAVAARAPAAWRMGDKAYARKIAQVLATSPYADQDGKRTAGEILKELGETETVALPEPPTFPVKAGK
jgi:hypothetical protein